MTIKTDVVIVGAGPCGLFQVFELGLLGIRAHIVDSLAQIGGQCSQLYPEKPIYDIPALPVCGAQELVDRLEQQIAPFDPVYHLGEEVVGLEKRDDGAFTLTTAKGTVFDTRTVVIAGGLGSFQPRPLRHAGADKYADANLQYRITDKSRYAGKDVIILGGGDSALDWALELYESAKSINLVHRRNEFRAQPASVAKMKALAEETPDRMKYHIGRVTGLIEESEKLAGIEITSLGDEPVTHEVRGDELLAFYGLSPNLGPIAEWGLEIDLRVIKVDTEKFQTSVPGVFAVGDINTYPGKKKLILSGFHEAALAAFAIQKHIDPSAKQNMQYTTTSPLMHKRLGVTEAETAS